MIRKSALDFVVVIFFKNAEKVASGCLIGSPFNYVLKKIWLDFILVIFFKKYLCSEKDKFRINLILYFNFLLLK